ncbi:MAG: formylglycine-generating enzyme family protein [Candidatus Poribacteria bacterium]|nr:formylglycine-generating enzyme family protein [Candidatus Poribacteria bacterium]
MSLICRRVFYLLMVCFLIGCGETEDPVVPVVTIEFVGYKDLDVAQFVLKAKPRPDDLAVLIEFIAEGEETFHSWKIVPKGPASLTFTMRLDSSVAWEVSILPFWEKSQTDYPLTGVGLSSYDELIRYELGDPYKVESIPLDPTELARLATPKGMVLIPEGEFLMGSDDPDASSDEKPSHTVYIDAFYMDIHEVTVGEYKRFVRETGHSALPSWVYNSSPTDQFPVVGVSWYDAMAYAKWIGKRLPTEAEWEKAARGGLSGEKYPWGNDPPDGTQCNYADKNTVGLVWNFDGEEKLVAWADEDVDDGYVHNASVGSFPANVYGLHDMAGNAWEWCLDEYDSNFYASSPSDNPISGESIVDTVENSSNIITHRVYRGGSYASNANQVRVFQRNSSLPTKGFNDLGFRCVKPVDSDTQD